MKMRRACGFTYIGLMVMIAIIGITSSVVGMSLKTASRIEKEKELIWVGHQYRNAIRSYYIYHMQRFQQTSAHAGVSLSGGTVYPQFYPTSIDDLLKDPSAPGTLRHLRKKYIDPMTGKDDWVLVAVGSTGQSGSQSVSGQAFWGVRSNSDHETLKRDNFELVDFRFKGKTKYSEWEFSYNPQEDPSVAGAAAVQQPTLQTGTSSPTPTPTPTEQPSLGQ